MAPLPAVAPACSGCLGSATCWICTGEGCARCARSGRCHLCAPVDVALLVPHQREACGA